MIRQLFAFGIVGTLAAAVHLSGVFLLVELGLHPLSANILGFMAGFQVSYFGHRYWTFRGTQASHPVAASRFLLTATSSLAMNEAMFYLLLQFTPLPYLVALTLVLICVTPITFLLGKFWAFR